MAQSSTLESLVLLLDHSDYSIVTEICGVLTNFTADGKVQQTGNPEINFTEVLDSPNTLSLQIPSLRNYLPPVLLLNLLKHLL